MTVQVSIIVGSVLGATEYVADAVEQLLSEKGYVCEQFLEPDASQISPDSHWLICTSTHGAGDLPVNIESFADQLKSLDLTGTKATVIGLGDSSYDTFCQGAITMEKLLLDAGASLDHSPLHIDVLQHPIPEEEATAWIADKL